MKRGIITNIGRTKRVSDDRVMISGHYNQSDFNYYILYWDKIVLPRNNFISQTIAYEDLLIQLGVLDRPMVQFDSWSSRKEDGSFDLFVKAQSITASNLLKEKSDYDWNIHQIGEEIVIDYDLQKSYSSLKVGLFNCLPVPIEDINPEILMEFKFRRKDELENLHRSIDELYFTILNSSDIPLQKKITESEFKNSLQNLEKISFEHFGKTSKYDFTTELNFNVKDVMQNSSLGYLVDTFTHGSSFPIISILTGLASIVNVKLSKSLSLEENKEKLKLSYLANANKEGIIS